jgi:hypothetical protein
VLAWWWFGCGGKDDGPVRAHTGAALEDADGDGVPAGEDCDDADDDVYPGARDIPYDGVDADCAGDDDFDDDGDGHASAEHGGDDCNDVLDFVSPSEPEVPYDGLDNDCDPTSPDEDLDGDGFRSFEECDDADPSAFPGGSEVAFDGVDQDCDGAPDSSAFGEVAWALTAPRPPRAVDTAHGVAVMVRADLADGVGLAAPEDHPVVLVSLPHDLRGAGALDDPPSLGWGQGNADPTTAESLAVVNGAVEVGVGWLAGNGYGYLGAVPTTYVRGVGWFPGPLRFLEVVRQDWRSVSVWADGADTWVAGAGPEGVGYGRLGAPTEGGADPSAAGQVTFHDPGAPATFVTCDDAACTSWVFDPDAADPAPTPAPAQPWAGQGMVAAHDRPGELVWRDAGPGLHWTDGTRDATVFGGDPVADGDVVVRADELFAVAVVHGDVFLAHGPLGGPHDVVPLPVTTEAGRTMAPEGAALVVRDDAVFVAVSARDPGDASAGALLYLALAR